MRQRIAVIRSAAALLGLLVLFLVAMVGLFWVLEIVPLLALLGVGVYYAVMSSRSPHASHSKDR